MLFGKHLNKYYLRYIAFFIIGVAALVVVDIAQLQVPGFLKDVIDIFDSASTPSGLVFDPSLEKEVLKVCNSVLILGAIMFAGRVVFRYTIFYASHKMETNLRHDMFLKAERLPVSYYHENKVGNIMSWFTNDLETIQEFLGWGTVMLVDALFLSTLAIIYLFRCNWQLSIIAMIPISLIIVWGGLVEKAMANQWGYRQEAYDELYDYSQESFTGIRVIKAFVKETQQVFSFGKIARKNKDVNIKFVRTQTLFDVVITLIIGAICSLILCFGGWLVYSTVVSNDIILFGKSIGEFKAGDLAEFFGLFDILIWPMIALGQVVAMYSRARASLKRVSHFLDAEEEIFNAPNPITLIDIKGEIEFKNFEFTYPGSNGPSLKNISLKINAGETIGIVGKIGCGKTTLVNSLLRIYNVKQDSIFIDGNDLMECDIENLRNVIAYVPQDNFLFSDTIKNNIAFSDIDMDDERVTKSAMFSDVHNDITQFANGYETVSGERGVTLSGGQKQRISIARAFAKNAPILILDDSVSAVDVKTEETILNNIKNERNGLTTIVIASRISTVSSLDRILVLKDGEVEAFGSHDELLKTSKTYQAMVMLQELEKEKGGI